MVDNCLIIYKAIGTEIQIVHIPYARSDYVRSCCGVDA